MPGESFPYYITPSPLISRSPLGFLFIHYEYRHSILRNDIIEQTLVEAGHKINKQLAQNSMLENQALGDKWIYIQEKHKYMLDFTSNKGEMTYGDISTIIPVISTWATQYAGVECNFNIWVWLGMSTQRKLGTGHLSLVA